MLFSKDELTISQKNWIYLIYGENIISEGELIVNNPTRTIDSSFLKKYDDVRIKGKNESFIELCIRVNKIEPLKIKMRLSGPVYLPITEYLLTQYEKRKARGKKRDLYERGRIVIIQIQRQLQSERANDRRSVLEIAYNLIEELTKELKMDLLEE